MACVYRRTVNAVRWSPILAVLLVTSCSASPKETQPSRSAPANTNSPAPTDVLTPPSPDPSAEPQTIAAGLFAEVVVEALNVRAAPGTTSELGGSLVRGQRVFMIEGPVQASDLDWYYVSADPPAFWVTFGCETPPHCSVSPLGWVAAGPANEPWLKHVDVCPPKPIDTLELHALGPLARLSCLRGEQIIIRAQVSLNANTIDWQMPGAVEPAWLGGEYASIVLIEVGGRPRAVLPVRYAPIFGDCSHGGALETCTLADLDGEIVELELLVDHPDAASCHAPDVGPTPIAVLRCRAQLVVIDVRAD
jgi:hypothetical protein